MVLPLPVNRNLLESVVQVARAGGETTLKWFRSTGLEIDSKTDGTPVTVADRETEKVIRALIEELAPGSSVIGEEYGATEGDSGLVWHVDPIDGTKAFMRGVPLYATLVSVNDDQGPAASCIYIPATGEIVSAGRGLGCFTDDGPARVSDKTKLDGAFLTTSSASRWGDNAFANVCHAGAEIKGWGDGYGFLLAATGRVDAMVDLNGGKLWDFAPMPLIFSEAGGRFTNEKGEIDPHGPSGIASNGAIHDDLLQVLHA